MRILNAHNIATLVPVKRWINPIQAGLIEPSQVIPGGRLINGEVQRPASNVRIWKSVGMALFDLFAAVMLYKEAQTQNIGRMVDV